MIEKNIEWHVIKEVRNEYILTIEGSITPQDIYYLISDTVEYDEIIITSYDMEVKDFRPLVKVFEESGIDIHVNSFGIKIKKGWISCVFDNTDYGESQDSYKLISFDNPEYDIDVDYKSIPDLKIISKQRKILDMILERLLLTK